jgi:hypothetical protein
VATLVCGVFGLLKISIGEKQAPNKELTTIYPTVSCCP